MFSKFAKLILLSSSVSPILLVWGVVFFRNGEKLWALCIAAVSIFLFCLCGALIKHAEENFPKEKFITTEVEVADREVFSFLAAYLMPLVFGQEQSPDPYILATVIIVFATTLLVSYNYHFNPVLSLRGWHFYRVKNSSGMQYILLTKSDIKLCKEQIQVAHLTDYLLLQKS